LSISSGARNAISTHDAPPEATAVIACSARPSLATWTTGSLALTGE